jgi:hypothetical protein
MQLGARLSFSWNIFAIKRMIEDKMIRSYFFATI